MKITPRTSIVLSLALWISLICAANANATFEVNEKVTAEIGFWTQGWYQFVQNGSPTGSDVNDFMVRRAYLYLKGEVTPHFEFFTHIATDRLGQEGLHNSSLGLGSGVAFRDIWATFKINEAFKIQLGRMYVPLTRSFGTTSTKALLTTDLPFLQGGVRGNIFYESKVGREDGVTLWGNLVDGLLQYRVMTSEGVTGDLNSRDNLRFSGRIALNLLEPETGWFNQGTYLGKKKVLSLGFGYDTQRDLTLNGIDGQDNHVWTVDVFLDYPVRHGAITAEASYISIFNSTQSHGFSTLKAGEDAQNGYIQAGYLFSHTIGPGRTQPYVRYETIDIRHKGVTQFFTLGANYYVKDHDAKVSVDYTFVDARGDRSGQSLVTDQIAIGL